MRATAVRGRIRPRVGIGAVTAAMLLATVAACSSVQPAADSAGKHQRQETAAGADAKAPGALKGVPVKAPADVRSIVYKGEMTVRVEEVNEAAAQASTYATGAGGVVAGDNRRSDGDDSTADLILRVPAKAFYDTVDKVGKLGDEANRGIHTDDVTQAVVDLDARIASQKASVDRTRTLLSRADRIADIVTIEGELARREADLASLQAQKRTLADQVTLSTITVHLVGPSSTVPEDEPATFLTGLAAGWHAFTASVNAILVALGAALPFLVAIGLPLFVWFWFLRRRRRTTAAAAPAPATDA